MESKTVFGHLALRFAVHPENLATEALSFILRTSTAASRAFTAFVREIGLDDPGSLHVDTQQGGLDQSIPDMKCYDVTGRLRVVVENKFWAGLTENQPVTYIHELPAGVSALVLFVVPKARLKLVWNEVAFRCRDAGIPVSDVEKPQTMKAADIGGGHYLAATSWGVLLDALSVAATSAGEIDARNDIAQLQGLCRRMDEETFLPLSCEELTNLDMARRFINFSNLPFGIVDEAVNLELCIRKNETNYRHASGAYVRFGEYTAWVGFDRLAWRSLGGSPIWVIFPRDGRSAEIRKRLARFRTATPQRCFDIENGRTAVPIFLTPGVAMPDIVENAVSQIKELRVVLGVREPPAADPKPTLTDDLDTEPEYHTETGKQMTGETILELGAEGGSLTLFGNRDAAGQWRFWTQTDETTMIDLLDGEDLSGLGSLDNTSAPVYSLHEALALLDKYPWYRLTPLQVHPEFRLVILGEVQKRGTPEEVASWNSRLCAG
ncbi:MAG: hypothetical protein WCE75_03975 [Terracidiphilus sp.]